MLKLRFDRYIISWVLLHTATVFYFEISLFNFKAKDIDNEIRLSPQMKLMLGFEEWEIKTISPWGSRMNDTFLTAKYEA